MTLDDLLRSAIRERRLIRFRYADCGPDLHLVEPYALGYNSAGDLMLNGWFEAGPGDSSLSAGCRDYVLGKISSFELLEERFDRPKLGYVPRGGRQFLSVVYTLAMDPSKA